MKRRNQFFNLKTNFEGEGGSGGGGGSAPTFKESLGEYAENPSFANFENISQLAKSYDEIKAMQGNSIRIPGQDASEEAVKEFNTKLMEKVPTLMAKPDLNEADQSVEFYKQLGMPDSVDGYEIPVIEGIEHEKIDPETIGFMKDLFHKNHLSKKQFENISSAMIKQQNDINVAAASVVNKSLQELNGEWGNAFSTNIKIAKQAALDTGAPAELIKLIDDNKVNGATLKWLHSVGVQLGSEGREVGDQGKGGTHPMTPGEARSQIDEMLNNKQHPYWVAAHPGHADAIKKMVELQGHANP